MIARRAMAVACIAPRMDYRLHRNLDVEAKGVADHTATSLLQSASRAASLQAVPIVDECKLHIWLHRLFGLRLARAPLPRERRRVDDRTLFRSVHEKSHLLRTPLLAAAVTAHAIRVGVSCRRVLETFGPKCSLQQTCDNDACWSLFARIEQEWLLIRSEEYHQSEMGCEGCHGPCALYFRTVR